MIPRLPRYQVYRVNEENVLVPAVDADGDLVFRVGLVESRVREAAIEAAEALSEADPEGRYVVRDPGGVEICEFSAATRCPF